MDTPEQLRRPPVSFSSVMVLLAFVLIGAVFVFLMLVARGNGPLMRARAAARQVRCQAELMAVGKGLEMFANDFRDYPDSRLRRDPIVDHPGGRTDRLSGAHWLARAMIGHDGNGVDREQAVMGDGDIHQIVMKSIAASERLGVYLDARSLSVVDDQLPRGGDYQATGREVLIDSDRQPILYYRLSAGRLPQSETDGSGSACHRDNALITGATDIRGWDFGQKGRTGTAHCIGEFSSSPSSPSAASCDTFVGLLQKNLPAPPASQPGSKQGGYLLIAAGPDGIYGTADDIVQASMTAVSGR